MEMAAYDGMSVDYFYLGELMKSRYYHDRMIRGKVENDNSIMKKVTTNFLRSKRQARHTLGELKALNLLKENEHQRLPSPCGNNAKGSTQCSKNINLLTHYTEA